VPVSDSIHSVATTGIPLQILVKSIATHHKKLGGIYVWLVNAHGQFHFSNANAFQLVDTFLLTLMLWQGSTTTIQAHETGSHGKESQALDIDGTERVDKAAKVKPAITYTTCFVAGVQYHPP
jgi:hypothetical protein